MTKDEFRNRFLAAIAQARHLTSEAYQRKLPAADEIVLFGAGVSAARMSLQEAVDRLYLGDQWFFKLIDVAVVEVNGHKSTLFVRASNHTPCNLSETWNQGKGDAPFKAILGVLKGQEPPGSNAG